MYGTGIERVARSRSKPVFQFSLDGTLLRKWSSTHEVERVLSYANSNISACCRRVPHHNTQYGYIWRYESDAEDCIPNSPSASHINDESTSNGG